MNKYLIVGLGNIGDEYVDTRHNIGFKVLDVLAKENDLTFETLKLGDVTKYKFKGRTLLLLKPSTFMNLSGKAINYWMQAEKIKLENVLVITDDLALPFGGIRLRGKGGSGGHNGLKSVEETVGSASYARLRFGVGKEFSKGAQVNYVLGKWGEEEREALPTRIKLAIEALKAFTTIGLSHTMTVYNNK